MMIGGAFGNGYQGAQSALEVTSVLSSTSVALVQDSTEDTCRYIKTEFVCSLRQHIYQKKKKTEKQKLNLSLAGIRGTFRRRSDCNRE